VVCGLYWLGLVKDLIGFLTAVFRVEAFVKESTWRWSFVVLTGRFPRLVAFLERTEAGLV